MEESKMGMYRILEHDTADQIRIGAEFYSNDLEAAAKSVVKGYGERMAWCGGFKKAREYYQRIAIVDADTLSVVKEIFKK